MKFLADMGISPKTTAFLHALGHNAAHLADQGLERLPDHDIVTKARQEGRILLVQREVLSAQGDGVPTQV